MKYLGEFVSEVKNGKVKIPWKDSALKNAKWVLVETAYEYGAYVNLFIEPVNDPYKHLEEQTDNIKIKIIATDILNLSLHYLWELPEQVKDFLNQDTIVFAGLGDSIQVMSKKQHEEDMEMFGELETFIKKYFSDEQLKS